MRSGWCVWLLLACVALIPARVVAQTPPAETVEYYALDAVGSVRVVFDPAGNILGRSDYTPFGGELFSGTNMPSQRFAGLFRDGEAGLDYAQARSYQVRTGRFNAPDPVYAGMSDPQRWNRYTYALSNPLSFTDPSGLYSLCPSGECKPSDERLIGWMFGWNMPGNDTQDPPGFQKVLLGPGRQPKPEETTPPPPPKPCEGPDCEPKKALTCQEFVAHLTSWSRIAASGENTAGLGMMIEAVKDPWDDNSVPRGFKTEHTDFQGTDVHRHLAFNAGSMLANRSGGYIAHWLLMGVDAYQSIRSPNSGRAEMNNNTTGRELGQIMRMAARTGNYRRASIEMTQLLCEPQ
jgi:RHS repeat-associated protein